MNKRNVPYGMDCDSQYRVFGGKFCYTQSHQGHYQTIPMTELVHTDKQTMDIVLIHESINQMNQRMEKRDQLMDERSVQVDRRLEAQAESVTAIAQSVEKLAISDATKTILLSSLTDKIEGRIDLLEVQTVTQGERQKPLLEWKIKVDLVTKGAVFLGTTYAVLLIPQVRLFLFGP
jgi:hypothetical protein